MASMTQDQQSAYDLLRGLFQSYGLPVDGDIMEVLKSAAVNGDSADLVQIQLQGTASWKQRFAGNETRRNNGLSVLSVGDYLQQEKQYGDILHAAGLPSGFYDDPSDFSQFIGNSVSPAEIQDRVNIASDIVNREDPAVMAELSKRGLTTGSLMAHVLDPTRAAPIIKREAQSILIGAASARAGVDTGTALADDLASRGIQEREAAQGFGQVAALTRDNSKLAEIYGVGYGQSDAVGEVFNSSSDAKKKRERLASAEKSNFSGTTNFGVTKSSTGGQL